jgi:hypothetical protein
MCEQQEHNKWIASEFVTDSQPGYQDQTVMGKIAGGQYQYEITLQKDGKWVLFPAKIPPIPSCSPVTGSTSTGTHFSG